MTPMAIAALNPQQSRRAAIGILLGVALLIVLAIALPVWLLHRHYDTALTESANLLEKFTRIAAARPEIARQLEAMRGKETRKFFLRSGAPALSAAEAQETLRSLVEGSGGRLITMQAPVSKEEGRYRLITVNMQLTANMQAMRKILNAIESSVPYLFVDNVKVTSQVPGNFRPQPGAEPEVFVQLDVSGYALVGAQ
jgi:general secretion pathway protein M